MHRLRSFGAILHFFFDLVTGGAGISTYDLGDNASRPQCAKTGVGLVDCFSIGGYSLRSINLSDQAAKECIFGHWHRMQGLSNTFQLVEPFSHPAKRFRVPG